MCKKPVKRAAAHQSHLLSPVSRACTFIQRSQHSSRCSSYWAFGDSKLTACEGRIAEVVLADEQKLSFESQDLINELRRCTDDERIARAEVNLIGTLKERKWHCFTARYVITAVQITPTDSIEVIDSDTLASELKNAN